MLSQENYQSIFDIIEEKEDEKDRTYFKWTIPSADLVCEGDTIMYQGQLTYLSPKVGTTKKAQFILTRQHIIKLSNKNGKIKKVLILKNPRIQKTNNQEQGLYGFRLTGFEGKIELFTNSREDQAEWLIYFKKVGVLTKIASEFQFNRLIGKGNFAKVHLAMRLATIEKYAIKTIEKTKILDNPRNMKSLIREIDILREMDHPAIIKMYEVYESEFYVHLVMEYLKGGELFQQIQTKGFFSEKDASTILRNILAAIAYFHEKNIVHRDLKPENMILSNTSDLDIKIADFGLATRIQPGNPEFLRCGSPGYVAPEILNNLGYETKADVFSAGVIFYILLSGVSPFHGRNYQEVLSKNKACNISFADYYWSNVSANGKDLVTQMLQKDPALRHSAESALKHHWFQQSDYDITWSLSSAMENIKKYHPSTKGNRFNVEKIKPEFSMLTCTPVMCARGPEKSPLPPDSPLNLGRNDLNPMASPYMRAYGPPRNSPGGGGHRELGGIKFTHIGMKGRQAPGLSLLGRSPVLGPGPSTLQPPRQLPNFGGNVPVDQTRRGSDPTEGEIGEDAEENISGVIEVKVLNNRSKGKGHKSFQPGEVEKRRLPMVPGYKKNNLGRHLSGSVKKSATPGMQPRKETGIGAAASTKGGYLASLVSPMQNRRTASHMKEGSYYAPGAGGMVLMNTINSSNTSNTTNNPQLPYNSTLGAPPELSTQVTMKITPGVTYPKRPKESLSLDKFENKCNIEEEKAPPVPTDKPTKSPPELSLGEIEERPQTLGNEQDRSRRGERAPAGPVLIKPIPQDPRRHPKPVNLMGSFGKEAITGETGGTGVRRGGSPTRGGPPGPPSTGELFVTCVSHLSDLGQSPMGSPIRELIYETGTGTGSPGDGTPGTGTPKHTLRNTPQLGGKTNICNEESKEEYLTPSQVPATLEEGYVGRVYPSMANESPEQHRLRGKNQCNKPSDVGTSLRAQDIHKGGTGGKEQALLHQVTFGPGPILEQKARAKKDAKDTPAKRIMVSLRDKLQ